MFTLVTREGSKPVLMKDGTPFVYSSRAMAEIGKKVLAGERKTELRIKKQN